MNELQSTLGMFMNNDFVEDDQKLDQLGLPEGMVSAELSEEDHKAASRLGIYLKDLNYQITTAKENIADQKKTQADQRYKLELLKSNNLTNTRIVKDLKFAIPKYKEKLFGLWNWFDREAKHLIEKSRIR